MAQGRKAPQQVVCKHCDKLVIAPANFCGFCGRADPGGPHQSLGGAIAILVTLAWLPVMAYFFSDPTGDEPGRLLFLYTLGLMAPLIVMLVVALIFVRKAGQTILGPRVAALIALTWLVASLIIGSRPSTAFVAQIDWLFFTLGLLAVWVTVLFPAAHRAWRTFRRAALPSIVAYLLPVPLAFASFIGLVSFDIAKETRLQISESALGEHVAEFQRTGVSRDTQLVGLIRVEKTYRDEGCVMLRLGQSSFLGVRNENGLAYCPEGRPPEGRSLYLTHEYGDWWTYETTNS